MIKDGKDSKVWKEMKNKIKSTLDISISFELFFVEVQ